jgi:hypothetical protein
MTSLWQDRLAAWRQEWVGRTTELAWFQEALTAPAWPFPVWMVTGPPGIGKTALLQGYAQLCREAGIPIVEVDARTLDAQPIAFLQALQPLLREAQNGSSGSPRAVFLLDHYEQLMSIDLWLRNTFFPQLPQSMLLLLASRDPPSRIWPGDPGWSSLIFLIRLGSLRREEASDYLEKRGIPKERKPPIMEFAHGHPLALRLTADWALQHPDQPFHPMAAPEVVQALRELFCPQIPGPAHRAALEACAVVRALTEDLLSDLLDSPEDARELFAWLQRLPFVESRPQGLVLDDAVREVLGADLCWRNPDRFVELHRRIRSAYIHRLQYGPRAWQPRFLLDCIYLHRTNPKLRPFLRWETVGSMWADRLREEDVPQLVAMVERHEGQASAALAAGWLKQQPQGVTVFRASDGEVHGFLLWITLYSTGPEDPLWDPATQAARAYLEQEAPLRPGERATLFRFWMARESYQAVSEVQTLCFICAVQHHLSTPGLAFLFFPCADPEFWEPVFAYMGMKRIPAADFEVEGRRYGVHGHDWRVMPAVAWLSWMAEQEVSFEPRPFSSMDWTLPHIRVLSRSEFDEAVREALRGFGRPEILQANPLLHTRLVLHRTGLDASLSDRIMALQDLMGKALAAWEKTPRDRKLYEALRVTYLHPAPTQEQAAERLNLPFSTYRRHLKHGIARLCQRLWEWEIGSASV